MAKVIAFVNHKGGVGKTTCTVNTGAGLALLGYRVLLVDMDQQHSLTYHISDKTSFKSTIYNALVDDAPLPILHYQFHEGINENNGVLDFVPGDENMNSLDAILAGDSFPALRLKEALDPVCKNYDFILIDCPPSLQLATSNAIGVATDIYLVTMAEVLPAVGVRQLESKIKTFRKYVNPGIRISGLIFSRVESNNLSRGMMQQFCENYSAEMFHTYIRKNVKVSEAPAVHRSIYEYSPDCNGVVDYSWLVMEITNRCAIPLPGQRRFMPFELPWETAETQTPIVPTNNVDNDKI